MAKQKLPAGPKPFAFWVQLGEKRTLKAVAEHWDVDIAAVSRRAAREDWRGRLAREIEPRVQRVFEEKVTEEVVENLAQFRVRQARIGASLVDKGMEALAMMEPQSVDEALKAIKLGSDLQARALEQPKSHVAIEVTHALREKLAPAQAAPRIQQRPRLEVTVADSIDDLLTDDEKRSVIADMEKDDE